MNDAEMQPIAVHSVVLSKALFDPLGMQTWMKSNGLSLERPLDLGDSVVFIQKDAGPGVEFETLEPSDGIVVHLEKGTPFQVTATFRKDSFNDEERTVEGIVYEPYAVDYQGDWATPEDIQEAAHDFLKRGLVDRIDTQHNFQANGAYVVESFLAKEGDPHYKAGTWVVKVKIPNDAIWAKVKSGKITGFSMAGGGRRTYYDIDEDDGFRKACAPDADNGKPKKGRTRLTKFRVNWISLVDEGANLKPFSFVKSATPQAPLWMSNDQRVIDGGIEHSEGFFRRLELFFKKHFGGRSPTEPIYPEPALPVLKGKAGIDVDKSQAGIFVLLSSMAGRLAKTETILKSLAANPQFAAAFQGSPALTEALQKMNPGDLERFQKDVMTAFMSQSGANGVSLPDPQNFFGWAAQNFDIGRFASAQSPGFPGGGMDMGSVAGASASFADLATMKSQVATMEKQLADVTAKFLAASTENADLKKSLGTLQETLKATDSRVEALQKAATQPSAPTPPSDPKPNPAAGQPEDPILKNKNNEHPFVVDPVSVFGGIKNSGNPEWTALDPFTKK